jgi:hypothetical protein
MLLKTKDRVWRLRNEAGMSLIAKEIRVEGGNFAEKKGV